MIIREMMPVKCGKISPKSQLADIAELLSVGLRVAEKRIDMMNPGAFHARNGSATISGRLRITSSATALCTMRVCRQRPRPVANIGAPELCQTQMQ